MPKSSKKNKKTFKLKTFLKDNKIYFETITVTLVSFIAIIISINQCNISTVQNDLLKAQNEISKYLYLSTIEPDIRIKFMENKKDKSFDLKIKNSGLELVYEIEIKNSFKFFEFNNTEPIFSISDSYFRPIVDSLNIGDSVTYKMPRQQIEPTIKNFQDEKKSGFPIIMSKISFRRFPDNKKFEQSKFLLLLYNPKDGIVGSVDLENELISNQIINKNIFIE